MEQHTAQVEMPTAEACHSNLGKESLVKGWTHKKPTNAWEADWLLILPKPQDNTPKELSRPLTCTGLTLSLQSLWPQQPRGQRHGPQTQAPGGSTARSTAEGAG